MGEDPKKKQRKENAHVVQLLLDVSKLGDVEIASPDCLRLRHGVTPTVTRSFSQDVSPSRSGHVFLLVARICPSHLLFFVGISCHFSCLIPSHTRKSGRLVAQGQPGSVSNTHTHLYIHILPALDLSLDHLEFSALPSGLHLVEQDVVCVLSWRFSRVLKFPTGILQKTANMVSAYSKDEKRQKKATEASDSAPSVFFSPGPGDPVHGGMSQPSSS